MPSQPTVRLETPDYGTGAALIYGEEGEVTDVKGHYIGHFRNLSSIGVSAHSMQDTITVWGAKQKVIPGSEWRQNPNAIAKAVAEAYLNPHRDTSYPVDESRRLRYSGERGS